MYRKIFRKTYLVPAILIVFVFFYIVHYRFLTDVKLKKKLAEQKEEVDEVSEENLDVDENIHAFYYAWYGNEEFDEDYYHWNHRFLPSWNADSSKQYAIGERHIPPNDIGANFYPSLGTYSSSDPTVQKLHMYLLKKAKIGVIAVSWYPNGKSDDEGVPRDELFFRELLDSAQYGGIKVCFHIEPYEGRTAQSVAEDMKYIIQTFGDHDAFYRRKRPNAKLGEWDLPMFYVYDSYRIPASEWKKVLSHDPNNPTSIRSSPETDAFVIGLLLNTKDLKDMVDAEFDGFYTYFASGKVSQGSTRRNWKSYANFAKSNNMLFIPSVGPGYVDTNIRPWNDGMTVDRKGGQTYRENWKAAIECKPEIVSITSFNEWHEGTQIEPAISKVATVKHPFGSFTEGKFEYPSYASEPGYYLSLNRQLANEYSKSLE